MKTSKTIRGILFGATFAASCAFATPALAQAGDFIVRVRGLAVIPDESADISIGGEAFIETAFVPELDFSYFLTDNIAVELIAAITPHDVRVEGSAIGDFPIGEVWLLPPTLTVQYHVPFSNGLKPYVGAGVNYTWFFDEDPDPNGPITDFDHDSSFGLVLQAGSDFALGDRWLLNVDVKKVWINTNVTYNDGAVTADVDIDPWLVGVGLGYRF